MRYGYFMMPMHPPGSDISVTLQTDLAQIERLDGLDFGEAWIGEHFTAEWENIAAPDIFIGAALQRTRHIKLGTGVSCLPNHNPFHLAHRIAMLDQLARGRFLWGIGSGGFPGDFDVAGIDPRSGIQRQISIDTVDTVLALWDNPIPGINQQHGWTFTVPEPDLRIAKHVYLKPYQRPHPPIAVAGVTEKSETLGLAGERGWRLTSDGLFASDGSPHPTPAEEDIYATIRLPFIPPEIRNGDDEVEVARRGELPTLLSRRDIRGDPRRVPHGARDQARQSPRRGL